MTVSREDFMAHIRHALEGLEVAAARSQWQIEITAIHEESSEYWIQLTLIGPSRHSLIVKLSSGKALASVSSAIANWLESPPPRHRLLSLDEG